MSRSTETKTIRACPECETPDPTYHLNRKPASRWECSDCGASFFHPTRLSQARAERRDVSAAESKPSEKRERLQEHLKYRIDDAGGEFYFKGKFIEDDVGLSSKKIGNYMVQIDRHCPDLVVEPWAYTSATTWRVRRAGGVPEEVDGAD